MSKFKVGDKVKVVKKVKDIGPYCWSPEHMDVYIGEILEITRCHTNDPDDYYTVYTETGSWSMSERSLELVEEAPKAIVHTPESFLESISDKLEKENTFVFSFSITLNNEEKFFDISGKLHREDILQMVKKALESI